MRKIKRVAVYNGRQAAAHAHLVHDPRCDGIIFSHCECYQLWPLFRLTVRDSLLSNAQETVASIVRANCIVRRSNQPSPACTVLVNSFLRRRTVSRQTLRKWHTAQVQPSYLTRHNNRSSLSLSFPPRFLILQTCLARCSFESENTRECWHFIHRTLSTSM